MITALAVLKLVDTNVVILPFVLLTAPKVALYPVNCAALALVKLPVLAVYKPIAVASIEPPVKFTKLENKLPVIFPLAIVALLVTNTSTFE